jgi:hypothetical protein
MVMLFIAIIKCRFILYIIEECREADDPLAVSGVYGTGGARAF